MIHSAVTRQDEGASGSDGRPARVDLDELRSWVEAAGLVVAEATTHVGTAHFGSIDDLVTAGVESTPLVSLLDDTRYRAIREEARVELAPFVSPSGALPAPFVGPVVVASPPDLR